MSLSNRKSEFVAVFLFFCCSAVLFRSWGLIMSSLKVEGYGFRRLHKSEVWRVFALMVFAKEVTGAGAFVWGERWPLAAAPAAAPAAESRFAGRHSVLRSAKLTSVPNQKRIPLQRMQFSWKGATDAADRRFALPAIANNSRRYSRFP